MSRYIVVPHSEHHGFAATVVDTLLPTPYHVEGHPEFAPVCCTFNLEDANEICEALNVKD